MNYNNFIKIDTNLLLENINYIKNTYKYSYYILNVSNNAFNHGMYLINYLTDKIDYLYVFSFQDLLLIRKYNKNIPVIYNGSINDNNIYDLIINNAIIVIHDIDTLKNIRSLNIKDVVNFIFCIDPLGFIGIDNKNDILTYLEWDNKYLNLMGIISEVKEKDYDAFKNIIKPLNNSSLMILNNEKDKRKIHNSNAILLDYSLYGINEHNKKIFKKETPILKQIFTLNSYITKIKNINIKKKEKHIAIIPFGLNHGMSKNIKFVNINQKNYQIFAILEEYTYILVDESIKENMLVKITSSTNPLEKYFQKDCINYFSYFNSNLPIIFENYILEKTLIY